jgi:hypothetical protein
VKYFWLRFTTNFFWRPRKGDIVIMDQYGFAEEFTIDLVDELAHFCLDRGPHHSTAHPISKEHVLFIRRPK